MSQGSSIINSCSIIILAAGASTRLGKPKQLLQVGEHSLIKLSVEVAIGSNADHVIVVLGNRSELLVNEIKDLNIQVVQNTNWEEGMASSLRAGISTILNQFPDTDSAILMVCDQPLISTRILNDLIEKQKKTGKKIITCNYGKAIGPPALFHQSFFSELMKLQGDVGARKIIEAHTDELITIDFPGGKIDIDTQDDLDEFIRYHK